MDPLTGSARNLALYPWFKFFQSLLFWQAVWFLFFQARLSAAEAVMIYAIYDISTTVLEVPSGYLSDRIGRRITLITSSACMVLAAALQVGGDSFAVFAAAQLFLGAGMAFSSGTDSALLYEALIDEDRADEIEQQELRAWRFGFAGLAISALIGGALSLWWDRLPFVACVFAFAVTFWIALQLREPRHKQDAVPQGDEVLQPKALRAALAHPVLRWLFGISVMMYVFSHIPFVFGQPFIFDALAAKGFEAQAPLVSGAVSTLMMLLSVLASLFAMRLRLWLGLPLILMVAFGMQLGLVGALAVSNSAFVIGLLLLRMVPDSLSRPFILARIQPLLSDDVRATYLSLKSLVGRLIFAATLLLAAGSASATGAMAYSEIRTVLVWYVALGAVVLVGLMISARRIAIDSR